MIPRARWPARSLASSTNTRARRTASTPCGRCRRTPARVSATVRAHTFGFGTVESPAQGNKGQRKKRLVVDADEAEIVRRIFALYLHGHQGAAMGCKSIAYFLNERGIARRGQRWTRTRVHEVLANEAYIGEYY